MCEPLASPQESEEKKMKYVNIILMVAMALLALREVMAIVEHGPSSTHLLFGVLFATFAVRRFMLMSKYSDNASDVEGT